MLGILVRETPLQPSKWYFLPVLVTKTGSDADLTPEPTEPKDGFSTPESELVTPRRKSHGATGLASAQSPTRSRRARLARALPEAADVEVAAQLMAAICAASVVAAIFFLPSLSGLSPGEPLVVALPTAAALSSWGMRRYPKLGVALAVVGVALTLWLLIAARLAASSGLTPLSGPLPWSIFGG